MSDKTHQKYPVSVQHGKPRLAPLKEGWNRLLISDLVEEVIRPVVMEDNELYTLVTAKRSRGGIVEREKLKGRDIAVKSQFYIREDDFLISKRQIVHGACGFVPKQLDGAIVSNEYLVLNFTDKIIPEFWNFLSYTVYFQQICFHSSIGVHIEKMLFKVEQWYRWKINIPSLEEQEKIASFLGHVDRRLTQLRRKQELLQTYKRGVMQKIFSQEIRFKGAIGSEFPDWEEKRLDELAEFKNGFNADKSSFGDGVEFVNLMDIFGKSEIQKIALERVQISSKQVEQYKIKKGDVLFVRSSVKREGVGQACLVNDDFEDTVYSGFIIRFREKSSELCHLYKKYCFSSLEFRKELLSLATSSANTNINQESLSAIILFYPCKKEQEKITGFLTAIDQKIEAISRQIDQTEKFKKGLLQKLFV